MVTEEARNQQCVIKMPKRITLVTFNHLQKTSQKLMRMYLLCTITTVSYTVMNDSFKNVNMRLFTVDSFNSSVTLSYHGNYDAPNILLCLLWYYYKYHS